MSNWAYSILKIMKTVRKLFCSLFKFKFTIANYKVDKVLRSEVDKFRDIMFLIQIIGDSEF